MAATVNAFASFLQLGWIPNLDLSQLGLLPTSRPFGFLRQPNQLATLLMAGLGVVLVATQWRGVVRGVFVVVFSAATAWSGSRTGLVQLVALGVVLLYWQQSHRKRFNAVDLWLLLVALASYFGVTAWLSLGADASQPVSVAQRLVESASCQSRWVLWSNVLELIAQRPWLGWGWGELDYAHFIAEVQGPRFCGLLDNAHNLPLHLAVELGVPLALTLCAGTTWWIWRNRPWCETYPSRQAAWLILLVIGIHSMLEYPLWYGPFQVTVVLCLMVLWQTRGQNAHPPKSNTALNTQANNTPANDTQTSGVNAMQISHPMGFLQRLIPVMASLALVGLAYAAWDYHRISQIFRTPEQRAAAYRENTLQKVQASWLFKSHVKFATLSLTPLRPDNAAQMHALALEMLHYSPEPRVVALVVESAVMLGRDADAMFYLQRFKRAYPAEHAQWRMQQTGATPTP